MSAITLRPLTFITPGMVEASIKLHASFVRRLSRCGRYYTYQVQLIDDRTLDEIERGHAIIVADYDDALFYLRSYGQRAGAVMLEAINAKLALSKA